jgi:hypothetical protein
LTNNQFQAAAQMEQRVRRVVTGLDAEGKAIVLIGWRADAMVGCLGPDPADAH